MRLLPRAGPLLAFFVVGIAVCLPALPARAEEKAPSLSVEIEQAINRGIYRLLQKQQADGSFRITYWREQGWNKTYPMGVSALAVYALVKSGVPPEDPCIRRALDYLRYLPLRKTYSVAVMIMAADAVHDPSLDPWIQSAGQWLEANMNERASLWAYPEGSVDLSNTQFAVLGLWLAERHGYRARRSTWERLVKKVLDLQQASGGFAYRGGQAVSGSMSTAGITVLALGLRHFPARGLPIHREIEQGLARGWAYMDKVFSATGNPVGPAGMLQHFHETSFRHYYFLYGVERICALCERREIGGRDWYLEGALQFLRAEKEGGGWEGLTNTAFALLFLRRATRSLTGAAGLMVSTGFPRAESWRYTMEKPAEGWTEPGFDDSGWHEGPGGFGKHGASGGVIRTLWDTKEIWIRRTFQWLGRAENRERFRLYVVHDDDGAVYLNGVKAADLPGWTKDYTRVEISETARAGLKRGMNVLAGYCRNTGGAQVFDIRFHDVGGIAERAAAGGDGPKRFWRDTPGLEVPFLRRWLVLGPVKNPDGEKMPASLLPDERADPSAGDRGPGGRWKEARALGPGLDFGKVCRRMDKAVYYAFTRLKAERTGLAVLYLGADDGFRVFLDGKLLFSHYANTASKPDRFACPLRLGKGVHRLLVKVYNHTGAATLHARIADTRIRPVPWIVPLLEKDGSDLPACALAHPDCFTLDELMERLPLDKLSRLEFKAEQDAFRLAVTACMEGYPRWLERSGDGGVPFPPPPGGRGLLAVRPPSPEFPVRLIRKVKVQETKKVFRLRAAAGTRAPVKDEKKPPPPLPPGVRLRLGVYDGTLRWLAETDLAPAEKPDRKSWKELSCSMEPYHGREVLLLVECAAREGAKEAGCAFLDEASLE